VFSTRVDTCVGVIEEAISGEMNMSYLAAGVVFELKTADSFAYATAGISEIRLKMLLKVIGFEVVIPVAGKVIGIGALKGLETGALTVIFAFAASLIKPSVNPAINILIKSFFMWRLWHLLI
jgi:hypothetical protein